MTSRPGHRLRWRWQWGTVDWSKIHAVDVTAAWVMLGAIVFSFITDGKHPSTTLDWVVLGVWLGPIAVALLAAVSFGLTFAVLWLRDHPPMRREWEQLPDLREEHRQ